MIRQRDVGKNCYTLICIFLIIISFTWMESLSAYADSNDMEILEEKGQNAIKMQRYEEAVFYFDQVLQIDPNNINALNNKGAALIKFGKYTDAISNFDKVLQIDPNNINALNNKGATLGYLGKYTDAISNFDKVLQIDPNNINALNNKENAITELRKKFIIYGQMQVRNSEGRLITYMELDKVELIDPVYLEKEITKLTPERTMIVNGKNYQIFKIANISENKKYQTVISESGFGYKSGYYIFHSYHDGYLVIIGDTVTFEWTVIRSAN